MLSKYLLRPIAAVLRTGSRLLTRCGEWLNPYDQTLRKRKPQPPAAAELSGELKGCVLGTNTSFYLTLGKHSIGRGDPTRIEVRPSENVTIVVEQLILSSSPGVQILLPGGRGYVPAAMFAHYAHLMPLAIPVSPNEPFVLYARQGGA